LTTARRPSHVSNPGTGDARTTRRQRASYSFEKPQRHRGHRADLVCPQITQMTQMVLPVLIVSPFPPTSSTIPTVREYPQITQIDPDEFIPACFVRQGSGRRPTARYRWAGQPPPKKSFCPGFPAQRPALYERRPRNLSSHSKAGGDTFLSPTTQKCGRTDVPTARRPVRSSAATNAWVRSRQASHRRQAVSDRLSFCLQ